MRNFDWLIEQQAKIQTPKFLVIDAPSALKPEPELAEYACFRSQFGALKSFRVGLDRYQMVLFREPCLERREEADYLRIGYNEGKGAAFLPVLESAVEPIHVWEGKSHSTLENSGLIFSEWLYKRFQEHQAGFSRAAWRKILDGPSPYTASELEIVRARELFDWSRVGVTAANDVLVEVHNGSEIALNGLTIGIRSNRLHGAVCVPVQEILPQQSRVIAVDCYKSLVPPSEIELVKLPSPGPEDRQYYWEFGVRKVITPKA